MHSLLIPRHRTPSLWESKQSNKKYSHSYQNKLCWIRTLFVSDVRQSETAYVSLRCLLISTELSVALFYPGAKGELCVVLSGL